MNDSLMLIVFLIGLALGMCGGALLADRNARPTVTVTTVHSEARHVDGVIVSDVITVVAEDVPAEGLR